MSPSRHRHRRLTFPLIAAAGAALAVPTVAMTAPVRPTADCVMVGGKDGLVGYFGYDNANAETVTIPIRRTGTSTNAFTPIPSNRGQGTDFAPGRHPGTVRVDMFPDQTLTWGIMAPGEAAPTEASASINTKRCLPNLIITITGPPTGTVGQTGTWVVTVTHDGYPDISPALQPNVGIPVGAIGTTVPSLAGGTLTPDAASVPADGQLRPGQSLTYTVPGPITGQRCVNGTISHTATTGLIDQPEARTDDNSATAVTTVSGCTVDLGIGITPNTGSVTPGDTVTWTVPITNTGNTPVNIADIHPTAPGLPNLTPVPGAPTAGTLAPGQSITYIATTTVTAGQCGTLTNTVRVGYGDDATPVAGRDTNPANDTATASVVVVCGGPDSGAGGTTGGGTVCTRPTLLTTVTGQRRVLAGQLTSVTLTAWNRSRTTPATDTRLRYNVPSGVTLLRLPKGGAMQGGRLTVKVGTLAGGAKRSVRVSLRVSRSAGGVATHRANLTAGCSASAAGTLAMTVRPLQGLQQPNVTG